MERLRRIFIRGRVVVYEPTDAPGKHNVYLDPHVGWVERKVFKNYADYTNYLKQKGRKNG